MDAEDALLEGDKKLTEENSGEERDGLIHGTQDEKKFFGPDDVLDEIGAKNGFIIFIFMAMSFVWCIGAPHSVISAFINESDESHCVKNGTDCRPTVSLRSEFSLYGDKASLAATSVSVAIAGDIFGGFALTALSDRYGRKPAVCISLLGLGIFGCLSALAPNIYVFLVTRCALGAFFSGCTLVNWVLSYESTPHSIRSFTTMLFGAMWVVGYCGLAPIAYYLHDWRLILAATAAPGIVVGLIYALILPESFHFLVGKRKTAKIHHWMKTAERCGKQKLTITTEQLMEHMAITHPVHHEEHSTNKKSTIHDLRELIGSRALLTKILIMGYLWIANSFVYYALSLFSTSLAGNRYVNFVLMGLVELPAYIISPFLLDRFGRRKVVSIGHAVAGFSMLAAFFLPSDSVYGALVLWLLAKCSISSSFNNIFIYASEVFPTSFRNFSIGLCSTTAKVVTIFAPHVGALAAIHPKIPILFYGFLGVTAALATLLLPETLNKPLPSTLSDVQTA
ncbi:hypothetical protein QR680_008292 [Steinernema hermaphroditum]|uniref:Major facilitator superfamily (MFS) profile domain-containing protein n=1 Tax=Steinernema hermaphroditum TaxID=289476 RepID=A0AA39IG49_9BILA|nr:hypothetical protein QR680_008292 [Steinernema hermaphroditum]